MARIYINSSVNSPSQRCCWRIWMQKCTACFLKKAMAIAELLAGFYSMQDREKNDISVHLD